MKIGVIPDVHGNKNYEQKVKSLIKAGVDHIIFLGDYCDSHSEDNNWLVQKACLDKILDLKKANPGYYTVLLGNHDLLYLPSLGADIRVSNRQFFAAADIQEYLLENYEYFQMIKVVDNWIFSHAGVSQIWLNNPLGGETFKYRVQDDLKFWKLDDINKHFKNREIQYFNHNSWNSYGDNESEGCTWIRPPSLIRYGIKGYNQCVGHTTLEEGEYMDYWFLNSRVVTGQEYYDDGNYQQHQYVDDAADNLENKYVFLDHPEQLYYAIIDTETNDVEILKVEE